MPSETTQRFSRAGIPKVDYVVPAPEGNLGPVRVRATHVNPAGLLVSVSVCLPKAVASHTRHGPVSGSRDYVAAVGREAGIEGVTTMALQYSQLAPFAASQTRIV